MKRFLRTFFASFLVLAMLAGISPDFVQAVSGPSFFKKVGNAILPINSSYTLGDASNRWDAFFDNADITSLTFAGFAPGDVTITGQLFVNDDDGISVQTSGTDRMFIRNTDSGFTSEDETLIARASGGGAGLWGEAGHLVFQARSNDASERDIIFLDGDGAETARFTAAGALTVGGSAVPTAASTTTFTNKSIDADNNTISNIEWAEFGQDMKDRLLFGQGSTLDSIDVDVTSDGVNVTLDIEKSGGGDIRFMFDSAAYVFDATPAATVTLTAGSDTSPQINYVYILNSSKTLTASTSGWPSETHAPIATVLVQSAASTQTDGPYKVHAWADHMKSDYVGHMSDINYWIRSQNATWESGVATTPTVGASTFDVATSAGVVLQLHDHSYPAFDTSSGDEVFMVNYPSDAFKKAQDLTQTYVDVDVNGTTLGGSGTDFYNLVLWGVVSEDDSDSKLMLNLPDGAYANNNGGKAENDDDNTSVYTIPSEFRGTGFLISRMTVQENAGTYSIIKNTDLRGQFPSQIAGGGAIGGNEFADNVFRIQDDGDSTKEIAFQASGITTGTTRTITVPDKDGTLAMTSDISSGSPSIFDASVCSSGCDYNDIQAAVSGVAGTDISLVVLSDISEDSDVTIPSGANLHIELSSYNYTLGDNQFAYAGAGNASINGNGVGSGAEVTWASTTGAQRMFDVSSTDYVTLSGFVLDNNSSGGSNHVLNTGIHKIRNIRYEGSNQLNAGFNGGQDGSFYESVEFVGGGTTEEQIFTIGNSKAASASNILFSGTWKVAAEFDVAMQVLNGGLVSNVTFAHDTDRIGIRINGGKVIGIEEDSTEEVDIWFPGTSTQSYLINADLGGGNVDVNGGDEIILSNVQEITTLDLTDSDASSNVIYGVRVVDAVTLGGDNYKVSNSVFSAGLTIAATADSTKLVNVDGSITDSGTNTYDSSAIKVSDFATGTDGELITWDTSGNPSTVAVGTSGQILTSNGTGSAPTFQAASTPTPRFSYNADFESSSRYNGIVTSGGTVTYGVYGAQLQTSATSDSALSLYPAVGLSSDDDDVYLRNPSVTFGMNISDESTGSGEFIISGGFVTWNGSGFTGTGRHWFGFRGVYSGGTLTLYATNGNNGTETQTDITSGITITQYNVFSAIYDTESSEINFYVNGTLEATHSTNLPNSTSNVSYVHMGVANPSTSDNLSMVVGFAEYSRDLY